VLQRWSFPFCPDTNLLRLPPPSPFADSSTFTYSRGNIYRCFAWQACLSKFGKNLIIVSVSPHKSLPLYLSRGR